jgi:hypothetical protein
MFGNSEVNGRAWTLELVLRCCGISRKLTVQAHITGMYLANKSGDKFKASPCCELCANTPQAPTLNL